MIIHILCNLIKLQEMNLCGFCCRLDYEAASTAVGSIYPDPGWIQIIAFTFR